MSQPIIKVKDIDFYYDYNTPAQTHALKNINLEIERGEYVVFFGPSGCGKTTLTYLLGGIETEKSGSGEIFVNDEDIRQLSRDELAIFRQTGIGIIFQQFNLIPSLSVLDNVALPMTFMGVAVEKRREEAHRILTRLDMDAYADRFPSELSGGQQQRVGIARALANDPPVILADEPIGSLDSVNAEHVLNFLKELHEKDGRTIIMVTHQAWSVRDAQKIVYLKDGAIVKLGVSVDSVKVAQPISPHLFRELYPDLTATEIMVKALANLLLRGFSADETKRFEFFLEERLNNKIDAKTFMNFLDLPFHEEGVGLWKQRAIKIAALTEDLITQKKEIKDIYHDLEKNPETPIFEEVANLTAWVLKEYKGKLQDIQKKRLEENVSLRLRNALTMEDFRKKLNTPRSDNGVGFSIRTTQHISDRLESALALGNPDSIISSTMLTESPTPQKMFPSHSDAPIDTTEPVSLEELLKETAPHSVPTTASVDTPEIKTPIQ